MTIPKKAVRAAALALLESPHVSGVGVADITRALEAAAPYLMEQAYSEGHLDGMTAARTMRYTEATNPYRSET